MMSNKKSWSELFETSQTSLNSHSTSTVSKPPSRPTSSFSSRPSSTLTVNNVEPVKSELPILPGNLDANFLFQRPLPVQTRPIDNRGNRCFMIAVIQALLHYAPFVNYFGRYFYLLGNELDTVLASGRFPLLAALNRLLVELKPGNLQKVLECDFVDELFLALPVSFSGLGLGEQQDAEEFLTVLLDSLAEELMELRKFGLIFLLPFESEISTEPTPTAPVDDGEWLQVGPKQRIQVTRSTPVSQSPIHVLFAGSFRSCFKADGPSKPSITFEPFTVLSLELVDVQQRPLNSVSEALAQATQLEHLPTGTKQLSFAALPTLLVIQLKRFSVSVQTGEFTKLTRPVRLQPRLQLGTEEFELIAVVDHWGSSLHGGHYTTITKRKGREWRQFDDELPVKDVLMDSESYPAASKTAYLLFYQKINI